MGDRVSRTAKVDRDGSTGIADETDDPPADRLLGPPTMNTPFAVHTRLAGLCSKEPSPGAVLPRKHGSGVLTGHRASSVLSRPMEAARLRPDAEASAFSRSGASFRGPG